MIEHLAELNRIMLLLHSLTEGSRRIRRNALIRECRGVAFEGRMPDHEVSILYATSIGFIEGKSTLRITEAGKSFVGLNPEQDYDLSAAQKRLLLRTCFLDGIHGRRVKEIFRCFEMSPTTGTLEWSSTDGTPLEGSLEVVEYLVQLGAVRKHHLGLTVNKQYASTLASFVNEPKGFTEEELLERLAEKKRLGRIAEGLALGHERARLRRLGFNVESECVRIVGHLKTNAGYDIESFDGDSHNMSYDRFIEVKGSGDPQLRFFWSQNEVKVAEELGDRYWIYYVGGIDKKTGKSAYKPIMIQDPIRALKNDVRITQTPNGFAVHGKFRGEPV
jgi:hypothetical protein